MPDVVRQARIFAILGTLIGGVKERPDDLARLSSGDP